MVGGIYHENLHRQCVHQREGGVAVGGYGFQFGVLDCRSYGEEIGVAGLEVHVVGCGGAAARAVVEHRVAVEFRCEPHHVGDAAGYELVGMAGVGDGEVAVENREWIDKNCVAVVPFNSDLDFRPVFLAQEAGTGLEGGCIHFRPRRSHACRVELHFEGHAVDVQFLHLDASESLEVGSGHGPCCQLSLEESGNLVGVDCHYFCLLRSIRAWSSQVRMRSL